MIRISSSLYPKANNGSSKARKVIAEPLAHGEVDHFARLGGSASGSTSLTPGKPGLMHASLSHYCSAWPATPAPRRRHCAARRGRRGPRALGGRQSGRPCCARARHARGAGSVRDRGGGRYGRGADRGSASGHGGAGVGGLAVVLDQPQAGGSRAAVDGGARRADEKPAAGSWWRDRETNPGPGTSSARGAAQVRRATTLHFFSPGGKPLKTTALVGI